MRPAPEPGRYRLPLWRASPTRPDQHVEPHGGGWSVRGDDDPEPSFVGPSRHEAFVWACAAARRHRSTVYVHRSDGGVTAALDFGDYLSPADPFADLGPFGDDVAVERSPHGVLVLLIFELLDEIPLWSERFRRSRLGAVWHHWHLRLHCADMTRSWVAGVVTSSTIDDTSGSNWRARAVARR